MGGAGGPPASLSGHTSHFLTSDFREKYELYEKYEEYGRSGKPAGLARPGRLERSPHAASESPRSEGSRRPLTRPSGTLSPTGERDGVRGVLCIIRQITVLRRNPPR
jgi:hypothetical protein